MTALSYKDVCLVPNYSVLRSRSEADISVEFLGRRFRSPVVPANMESVINADIAKWLSENHYVYFMHRFGDTREFIKRANQENWKLTSISVGVKEQDRELIKWIAAEKLRVDWVCIDIANGHSILMKEMIEFIKGVKFEARLGDWGTQILGGVDPNYSSPLVYVPKIIAGNVATSDGIRDLTNWGADACKIGISMGKACTTYKSTGFASPMFSTGLECSENDTGYFYLCKTGKNKIQNKNIPLILDGGIRDNGDFAKGLVAGMYDSDETILIMAGSLFAACIDAPGDNVYHIGTLKTKITGKKYWGSASSRQKGNNLHVEGVEIEIPCNGLTVAQKMDEIADSLRSAVSYSGGKDLSGFKNVKWAEVRT